MSGSTTESNSESHQTKHQFSGSQSAREQSTNAKYGNEARYVAKSYCSKYKVGWQHGVTQSYEITPEFQRVAWKALNLHRYFRLTNDGSPINGLLRSLANK